jgi:hypothetical protein
LRELLDAQRLFEIVPEQLDRLGDDLYGVLEKENLK